MSNHLMEVRGPEALRKNLLQRSRDELFQEIRVFKEVVGASRLTNTKKAKTETEA